MPQCKASIVLQEFNMHTSGTGGFKRQTADKLSRALYTIPKCFYFISIKGPFKGNLNCQNIVKINLKQTLNPSYRTHKINKMREFQKNIVISDLNILVAIQPTLKSKPKYQ